MLRTLTFTLIATGILGLPAPSARGQVDVRGSTAARLMLDDAMSRDATLRDVEFIDASRGWAVGDRGTIWRTTDGGRDWAIQDSGTKAVLRDICFSGSDRAWIAGGKTVPYSLRSQAVLLRSTNRGASWQVVPTPTLPALIHVHFFDDAHGIVVGESSAMFPSGVFTTNDGGANWVPLTSQEACHWVAASFSSRQNGVLVDRDGRWAQLIDGEIVFSPFAAKGGPPCSDLHFVNEQNVWRAGHASQLFRSNDSGTTWQTAGPLPLSPQASPWFDAHSVATFGQHVWIAGTPGTKVFHSADGGTTWQSATTGVKTPILAQHFTNERIGCAVGALGTILLTRDGGSTWAVARRGGDRAAVWMAGASEEHAPLELVARTAAGDGQLTAVDWLLPTVNSDRLTDDTGRRVYEALVKSGSTACDFNWRLSVLPHETVSTDREALLANLNSRSDGNALAWLVARAQRQLRMWNPDVVVFPHALNDHTPAVAAVVEQAVTAALANQGNNEATWQEFGLSPVQPKRVVGLLQQGRGGSIVVDTGKFMTPLGTTPEEFVSTTRGLLTTEHKPTHPSYSLELISQQPGLAEPKRDLMSGIFLAPGGGARRVTCEGPRGNLEQLRLMAQRRRHLVRLLEFSESTPGWSAQVVNLTGGLQPTAGCELLFQLAEGYRETGRYDLAADTYELMVRRYPQHPLVEKSLRWLIFYYSSEELAHAAAMRSAANANQRPLANFDTRGKSPSSELDAATSPAVSLSPDQRRERAKLYSDHAGKFFPPLAYQPQVRTVLAATQRARGFSADADKVFLMLSKSSAATDWRNVAAVERWLAEPTADPPVKPIAICKYVRSRPHLDGDLNDPTWQTGHAVSWKSNSDQQTRVRLSCDTQFLYLACECESDANVSATADQPRTRDADLRRHDRVQIRIDTDRDYTTAFELTVDYQGRTHDTCWGDTTWNPKWYVASKRTNSGWNAEVAIPWSGLSQAPPPVRSAWAVSLSRLTPQGESTWPANRHNSPEEFGLLLLK